MLDSVLEFLDTSASLLTNADLSANGFPSPDGYNHFASLTNKTAAGTSHKIVGHPDFSDTNNVPGGTNALTFLTMNATPYIQIDAPQATNILWHWGDGHWDTNLTSVQHDFGRDVTKINYIVVEPATALISFGAYNNSGNEWIDTVSGLTNFPALKTLWLWRDKLRNLSLTNCSSLRELHLAGNYETQ